ncbi:MAG: hypothetical protein GC160_07535 [Acidobacteria bacterium]|nr:hypothetical protein [Acidobacteriota bacterium]
MIRAVGRLAGWAGAWLAATALMKFGPRFLWEEASPLTLLAVGLNVAVGVGLILAHKRYLAELDELQQRVYLNALAVTVGVAVVASIPFSVLYAYHVVPVRPDVAHLVGLMGLTFLAAFVYGSVRYR